MEYLIGSILTLVTILIVSKRFSESESVKLKVNIQYNQTRSFELQKPLEIFKSMLDAVEKGVNNQTNKHHASLHVKVVIAQNEAYWISNNKFYVADVVDRMVVEGSEREVDTMTMDDVQLKRIEEIVEILRKDDEDDRGGAGYKRL